MGITFLCLYSVLFYCGGITSGNFHQLGSSLPICILLMGSLINPSTLAEFSDFKSNHTYIFKISEPRDNLFWEKSNPIRQKKEKRSKFPLAPMGVLTPGTLRPAPRWKFLGAHVWGGGEIFCKNFSPLQAILSTSRFFSQKKP